MILYYVLVDYSNGFTTTAPSIAWNAARLTIGGVMVGLIFAVIISYWMKKIIRDHNLSIVITIIGSYLSFYLC